MKRKVFIKKRVYVLLRIIAIIILCVVSVFPFFWMVHVSLKQRVFVYDPSVWIFTPTFENYKAVIINRSLGLYLRNSIIVAFLNTALSLIIGGLCAYGFSRFKFKRKEFYYFFLLVVRMLPPIGIVIPIFLSAQFTKLIDKPLLLVVVYMIFNVPFAVWMMRSFFEEIPREIEESAWIDGMSNLQTLYKIIMPLASPGLAATAIFCIINSWNEFVYALFTTMMKSITLPTIVEIFKSIGGTLWGEMCAVGTIATIPVLVFAMIVQKNIVRGLSFGAVKG